MKKTSKILPILAAALTCVAMLVSCDYWNDDWYKTGDSENAPLIGSTSNRNGSSSSSSGTSSGSGSGSSGGTASPSSTGTFAFKTNANPITVNGGMYQYCILTGNSTSGSITLAQGGTSPNLTGTYSSPAALAVAIIGNATIEGSWTVTFGNSTTSYQLTVTGNTLTISDGTNTFSADAVPQKSGYSAKYKAVMGVEEFAFFYPDGRWTFSDGFIVGSAYIYADSFDSTYSLTSGDFTNGKMSMAWPVGQAPQNFSGSDPYTGDVVITGGKFYLNPDGFSSATGGGMPSGTAHNNDPDHYYFMFVKEE